MDVSPGESYTRVKVNDGTSAFDSHGRTYTRGVGGGGCFDITNVELLDRRA